jgi:O-acetyl-ADP-ribose deacetylase (regulator of RNase III)
VPQVKRTVGSVCLESVVGDITRQGDLDAIVNAANRHLLPGGGVAGAIHAAAGPGLVEECLPLAPIRPGEAVITGGHQLPNAYVIHCLGPVFGIHEPAAEILGECYRNALRLADDRALGSIGFPAISTGVFGYPKSEAARVCLAAVVESAPSLTSVRLVRFVLSDQAGWGIYEELMAALVS